MAHVEEKILEFFDNVSAQYEATTGGCTRELARHLLTLLPPVTEDSKILDNACGNGLVSHELLIKNPSVPCEISCTDGAEAMVNMAKGLVPSVTKVATLGFMVMPGEDLKFPDDMFTHSITNQGIRFFRDGEKGASEIYRTLKPGGTAIVTTWKQLGYLPLIHEAQHNLKPDEAPFRVPTSGDWDKGTYMEKVFRDAGFRDITLTEKVVHYAMETEKEFVASLMKLFYMVAQGWSEEERKEFKDELVKVAKKSTFKIERPVNGAQNAEVQQLIGVRMIANVAVAKK